MKEQLRFFILKYIPKSFYPFLLKRWYKINTGKILNLKKTKTFNEKIQWLKLYDSIPIKTKLADKYLVRDWIKEKIGKEYLITLLGVWDKFDDIDFNILPSQFVLKANHGCGMNIIVKDKLLFNKDDAQKNFDKWLKVNFAFYGFEFQYRNINPKIIAEEYIDIKCEYKVFCIMGNVAFVLIEFENNTKRAYYDKNFKELNFKIGDQEKISINKKPKNFNMIIELAKILSKDFVQVRVDFYVLQNDEIKFSEMTFSSCAGISKWSDEKFNLEYGNLIHLPCDD